MGRAWYARSYLARLQQDGPLPCSSVPLENWLSFLRPASALVAASPAAKPCYGRQSSTPPGDVSSRIPEYSQRPLQLISIRLRRLRALHFIVCHYSHTRLSRTMLGKGATGQRHPIISIDAVLVEVPPPASNPWKSGNLGAARAGMEVSRS